MIWIKNTLIRVRNGKLHVNSATVANSLIFLFFLLKRTICGLMEPQLGGNQLYFAYDSKHIYINPFPPHTHTHTDINLLHYLEMCEKVCYANTERGKRIWNGEGAPDCGVNINTDDSICI